MIEDGPMKEHIERSKDGVLVAKYITYSIKNDMFCLLYTSDAADE